MNIILFRLAALWLIFSSITWAKDAQPELTCRGRLISFLTLQSESSPYHLGALQTLDFSRLEMREKIVVNDEDLRKGNYLKLYSDQELPAFKFVETKSGIMGERAIFMTALGDLYSFPIKRLRGGEVELQTKAKRVRAEMSAEQKLEMETLDAQLRNEKPPKLSDERSLSRFAQSLAEKQSGNSSTFAMVADAEKMRLGEALFQANSQMLTRFADGRELTLADISGWNHSIGQSSSDSIFQSASGLIRGSLDTADVKDPADDGNIIRVSVHGANIKAGGESSKGGAFDYTSAREVPEQMEALLRRVNSLNQKTPLIEVTKLFRDFIAIHPYVDGNGRTGRILFDYMLLKAGFPPVPENSRARNALYKTEAEHYEDLLNSYSF